MTEDGSSYDYTHLRAVVHDVWAGEKSHASADLNSETHVGVEKEGDDAIAVNVQLDSPEACAAQRDRLRDITGYADLADAVEEHVEACVECPRVHIAFYRQPTPFTKSVTFRGVLQPQEVREETNKSEV